MAVCAAGGFPVRVHVYCTPKPAGCQPLPMGLSSLNFCKTCAPWGTGEGDGAAVPGPLTLLRFAQLQATLLRPKAPPPAAVRLRFFLALRASGTLGDFIPQTPGPGTLSPDPFLASRGFNRLGFGRKRRLRRLFGFVSFWRFALRERWGISSPKPLARGHRPRTPSSLRAALSGLPAAESAASGGCSASFLFALRASGMLGDFIPQTPGPGTSSPDPFLASRGFKQMSR